MEYLIVQSLGGKIVPCTLSTCVADLLAAFKIFCMRNYGIQKPPADNETFFRDMAAEYGYSILVMKVSYDDKASQKHYLNIKPHTNA